MHDLAGYTFYRALIGSRAYGLAQEGSDTDTRGVYLPPADLHWSFAGAPEQLEDRATDTVYWEVGKFLRLALAANPTILEVLWSPQVLQLTPLGEELCALRGALLSRRAYATYRGYAQSQFARLERARATGTPPDWKHAMHLLRLLLSGAAALRDGAVLVDVGAYRDDLLAVRAGRWSWEDVVAWRAELEVQLDSAHVLSRLPDDPNPRPAEAFLLRARRAALDL